MPSATVARTTGDATVMAQRHGQAWLLPSAICTVKTTQPSASMRRVFVCRAACARSASVASNTAKRLQNSALRCSTRSLVSTPARLAAVKPSVEADRVQPTNHAGNSVDMTLGSSVVVQVTGPDRAGVVHDIASCLSEGNIEESRMTRLGSEFAVLLFASMPPGKNAGYVTKKLQAGLPGFSVSARDSARTWVVPAASSILQISVEGSDQAGVLKAFTAILLKHSASIRDLVTDTSSLPFAGGAKMMSLKAIVSVPVSSDMKELREDLKHFETSGKFDLRIVDDSQTERGSDSESSDSDDVAFVRSKLSKRGRR